MLVRHENIPVDLLPDIISINHDIKDITGHAILSHRDVDGLVREVRTNPDHHSSITVSLTGA